MWHWAATPLIWVKARVPLFFGWRLKTCWIQCLQRSRIQEVVGNLHKFTVPQYPPTFDDFDGKRTVFPWFSCNNSPKPIDCGCWDSQLASRPSTRTTSWTVGWRTSPISPEHSSCLDSPTKWWSNGFFLVIEMTRFLLSQAIICNHHCPKALLVV